MKSIWIIPVLASILILGVIGFSNYAYSNPTGDQIIISVFSEETTSFFAGTVGPGPEFSFLPLTALGPPFVSVDVDDGEIWLIYEGVAPGTTIPPHDVHIDDLDWIDPVTQEPIEGVITDVICDAPAIPDFDPVLGNIWIFFAGPFAEPLQIHCTFTTEHEEPEPASVHVLKFNDRNGDGAQELPDEEGIAGWTIWLECIVINTGEVILLHAETDDTGFVWFEDIPAPSICTVSEETRSDWEPTTPTAVTFIVEPGQRAPDINFGNQLRVIQVEIDIKPGSDPNSVNCKSKGDVPFAILSDENFDATTIPIEIVQMSLVSSGPIQVTETHNQFHLEDVNDDGLLDGVLHIKTSDICLFIPEGTPIRSTIEITLSGETTDGQAFEGSGNIVLKGKKILEN